MSLISLYSHYFPNPPTAVSSTYWIFRLEEMELSYISSHTTKIKPSPELFPLLWKHKLFIFTIRHSCLTVMSPSW